MAAILDFQLGTILAIFDLEVALVFSSMFQVKRQGGHFRFPIRTISASSDLQVNALILPTKFQVNWPFSSRKEVQNRFSRWRP